MKPAKLPTRPVGGYGDTTVRRKRRKPEPENPYALHQAVGIIAGALALGLFLIIFL